MVINLDEKVALAFEVKQMKKNYNMYEENEKRNLRRNIHRNYGNTAIQKTTMTKKNKK